MTLSDIKLNVHYIVTKAPLKGKLNVGDPLMIEHDHTPDHGCYRGWDRWVLFGIMRVDNPKYNEEQQYNDVWYFDTKEELYDVLEGVEVEPNKELAMECVKDLKSELIKIVETYDLTDVGSLYD